MVIQTSPIKKSDLAVDYSLSYDQMIALGCYRYIDERIIPELFSQGVMEKKTVLVELMHFGCLMLSDEVLNEFESAALRPATFTELLAFGVMTSNQRGFGPILAMDSRIIVSGERCVACIMESFDGRALQLRCWGDVWRSHCNFLGVHQ